MTRDCRTWYALDAHKYYHGPQGNLLRKGGVVQVNNGEEIVNDEGSGGEEKDEKDKV